MLPLRIGVCDGCLSMMGEGLDVNMRSLLLLGARQRQQTSFWLSAAD